MIFIGVVFVFIIFIFLIGLILCIWIDWLSFREDIFSFSLLMMFLGVVFIFIWCISCSNLLLVCVLGVLFIKVIGIFSFIGCLLISFRKLMCMILFVIGFYWMFFIMVWVVFLFNLIFVIWNLGVKINGFMVLCVVLKWVLLFLLYRIVGILFVVCIVLVVFLLIFVFIVFVKVIVFMIKLFFFLFIELYKVLKRYVKISNYWKMW